MGEADKKAMEKKIKDAEMAAKKEERRAFKEKMKKDQTSFFTDFKKFITKGNVLDMAVGIIIGGAFTAIVTALTTNLIQPFITAILTWNWHLLAWPSLGAAISAFLTAVINFILTALILFLLVLGINALMNMGKKKKKPSSKLDTIQKIVNILAGITTIIKMIFDILKG